MHFKNEKCTQGCGSPFSSGEVWKLSSSDAIESKAAMVIGANQYSAFIAITLIGQYLVLSQTYRSPCRGDMSKNDTPRICYCRNAIRIKWLDFYGGFTRVQLAIIWSKTMSCHKSPIVYNLTKFPPRFSHVDLLRNVRLCNLRFVTASALHNVRVWAADPCEVMNGLRRYHEEEQLPAH